MNSVLRGIKFCLRKTGLLPRFYHTLNRLHPAFYSLHPANLRAITSAMKSAPPGDYYEFGVYKGFSLWFATQAADALGKQDMRFFGFDSFDGLPEPRGVDRGPDVEGGTFARGCLCADLQLVQGFLKMYGADMSKVELIPGFFNDTLHPSLRTQYKMRAASVVLVDCDLYESTRAVLDFIPIILQPQTIILFDDWLITDEHRGQQLAVREWREKNPDLDMEDFCEFSGGKGFRIVHLPGPQTATSRSG